MSFPFVMAMTERGAKERLTQLETRRTTIGSKISELKSAVEKQSHEISRLENKKPNQSNRNTLWTYAHGTNEAHKRNLKAARKKHEDLKAQLDSAKTEVRELDSEITAIEAIETNTQQTLRLNALSLENKFFQQGSELNNIDSKLDDMERIYDQAEVGAYFQDKIGQLLNSNVICKARKRCMVSEPKEIPSSVIQNELFPESKKTRSEYYNKVKERGAR